MSDEVRYVRMRRPDEKAGITVRKYTHRASDGQFYKFSEAGIWHKVPRWLAEELSTVRQQQRRASSQTVFEVCTEIQARRLDEMEVQRREERKAVEEPSVDTARDLTGRGDLSIDEVTAGRKDALSAATARADGSADKEPAVGVVPAKPTAKPAAKATARPAKRASGRPRRRKKP